MTVTATTERTGTVRGWLTTIPWMTVVPLAVVMAYADGFWMTSLRGAVGAIERTQQPFAAWLRESALSLPFFVIAVIVALTFAGRRYGPVLSRPKAVVAAALMIVVAGTLVGIYEVATSSAYDYSLQSRQLQLMESMSSTAHTGTTKSAPNQLRASLGLQVRSVGYGSGILLVTNLVVVGWVVAIRGGGLKARVVLGSRAIPTSDDLAANDP